MERRAYPQAGVCTPAACPPPGSGVCTPTSRASTQSPAAPRQYISVAHLSGRACALPAAPLCSPCRAARSRAPKLEGMWSHGAAESTQSHHWFQMATLTWVHW